MADQQKKYLSEDEMGFGSAAKAPKYLSEADMGFPETPNPLRRLADVPVALAKGVVGAGEAAVGLADLATGGRAGKFLNETTGYDPKATKAFLDEQYSPQQKAAKAEVDQASGFTGKAKAMLENPSTIGEAVVESAPLMLGGGAVAQGLGKATKLGAVARSAIGEGVIGAGSAAEDIRQETPDGTLDAKQTAAAIGTGVGTAAITALSGGAARKLGISDLDTQLATRGGVAEGLANTSAKGRARRLAEGAITEGVLEEAPQSGLEQGLQNVALDKPIGEGVPEAMAAGMLTGAAMGGPLAAAPATAKGAPQADPVAAQEAPTLALPAPPPSTGTPGAQVSQAEAERADQVARAEANAAEIYRQRDAFDAARQANRAAAPLPFTTQPAEELAAQRKAAMGIDPTAGPLSAGAAIAVESQVAEEMRLGTASVMADGAERARQAQAERGAWEAANPGIPYEPVQPASQESRPAPAARQEPTGSFGAMNDFAELLGQERQDVAQRRAGIAERQGQRREFDLAEADRRTAESMQREAQARRRAVLDAVLADPETTNPAGRFAATLRREGYRDSTPTADELQTIQRFEDVRAAQPAPLEVEPSAPNELDPAAMGIRERRAPAEKASVAPPKNLREGLERARAARAAAAVSVAQVAPPAAAPSLNPGEAWARMDAGQRTALAGRLQGVPPIVSKNVHRADWAKINPALQGKLAEAMGPRTAAPIEGADLGDGWAAFRPESGTVGVPRAEMPQIKAEHRGAMVNFMNARGVLHQEETVPATSLKPTQAEFSREKVARAKAFDGGSRSILVSADNHVLDGHHQWMAARDKGEDVKVIRLDAPIRDLVGLAHDFPSSTMARDTAAITPPPRVKPRSLIQLVRASGGVSLDRKADIDQDSRTVGVFRRGGMDLDGLAELLHQNGFMTDTDVTDMTSGAERAAELLRSALAGERVLSMNDADAVMGQDAEAQYRDEIRQKAAGYGIRTLFRPFADIEHDVLAREGQLAPEDMSSYEYGGDVAYALEPLDDIDQHDARTLSEEEQMRAMGFSEDEINEAINRTNVREGQGAPRQAQPGAAQAGRGSGAQEDPGQEGPTEGLTRYTNEDIARREAEAKARAEAQAQADKATDDKARADAERDSFTLTGSDRPADVLAVQGQNALFDAPAATSSAASTQKAVGLQFSRGGGQAGEFVAAPDGSIDFGEITPEMAQAMRRQAGKIRLQHGVQNENGTGWGLAHIEANHGNQIRNAGFTSVEAFVSFVARNFNEVLQATNRQMLVAISGTRQDVMFVQLEPAAGGDYYRINTAFPASRDYLAKQQRKGMKVLWDGSEPAPAATGQQPPYAGAPAEESGQGAPIARGQSTPSVANPDVAGSPTAQKSAAPALPRPSITTESLPAIFAERFPKLASAIRTMMDRGALGQPGGLVVIGNAQEFADHSGRKLDDAVQLFESGDGIHIKGLYDKKTGITYLVGPNLTPDSAYAVVLHEMVHGQQRQALDQKALALIEGRAKEAPALRAFLDRVAARMEAVGEAGNPFEATSYIVEMAAQEGRQSGFSRADGPILAWIEHNIGRKVADMVRGFVATVRAWALAHGVELKAITVDDLVAYAKAGVGKAARGKVVTDVKAGPAPAFSRGSPEGSGVGRVAERLRDTAARAAGRPRPDPSDPFSAENTRLREQDKSLWQKAKGQLRRWLAPGGLLPDSVFAEKIARDSNFQAVEFDVRHIVGGFEQAVKQDFGVPFDKLTQAQQRTLSEALAGKVAGSLPAATKTAAVAMRQYIDSLSGEYLQIIQGKIDALQARAEQSGRDADKAQAINEIGLYEKIRNNVGAYVHRSYQAFDDPKWFQKVPTATLNAARQYLKGGYMEGGKTSEAEALRLAEVVLNEILKNGTAYDSMESFIAEGKLGAKDLSVLTRRKDVPPVIRALLGEYTDPRLNFTKSATKMGRLIWNQRFLDRVREMGMGTFLFEGKDRPPSATTQIAAQGSEVYAPLNGLWTFPEVAQAFKDALGKEQMGELYRFIVRANGLVKYGKTVLSPTTAMRNWQSAMFFALANGHFDLTQMKKSVAAFREQVRQNATDGDLAYLRHLKELGVVYDTPYAGEMMRFIEDAKADSGVDTVMRAFGASDGAIAKGLRGVKQINQVAQGFYSFGDDFWKIIGFENEKAGLLKAGLPVAEAEREAARRIRDTYPTYSMVGAGIQKLSRFPLMGTFVSFPAEIVRTSANMLRTTAADLKSDNPALRALGMKRAVGMAMVSGLFYGLAALSKAGSGVDDDEEEALRDLAPEWQKNSTFLFAGRDEKGQLRYFDMSFLDPYGYWKRPITAMLRDQPWEKSAASAIKDMLTPFFGADIATAAIFQVLANKKDSGGKVYQEGADALDQTGAIANHLRKALQPGFVGNIERLTLAAQGVRREGSGQPYDLNDEMTALLGWRASTMDPKTALYYRSFEFNDAMSEAKQVLTRTLRSVNPVSPEDIRDAREVAQRRQAEAFTEMRRLVLATQAAGMNPAQIRQVLKQSSISQANAEALMRGMPPRLVLGVPAAAKAVQQARALEGPEFAQEVARRYRMASGM